MEEIQCTGRPTAPILTRYRCFLPDLAGLAGLRRVGPGTTPDYHPTASISLRSLRTLDDITSLISNSCITSPLGVPLCNAGVPLSAAKNCPLALGCPVNC